MWYSWYTRPRVAEGIYAASMLNMFCREFRRLGVTIGCYFEPVNEGAIRVDPFSAELTPIGQVMALFAAHQGNRLVELGRADDAADVDVAASVPADGTAVVSLVNRSPAKSHTIEIRLPGDATAAGGTLLTAGDRYAIRFEEKALRLKPSAGGLIRLTLPKHSAALVRSAL